ncbi:helix-turn-helix domain-containing protein [Streptomyces sp. 35G-GA-8]|uniref:helix-turn-helix domain-containing protein n=1 Tax=Streptomyces sp. 35G-GA-8 TaxID=2939434 RepID=UPI00201F5551|nr:helix-turn-helix domain-containing protein [Streptomyces sp. 35G-GA-8]MCL7377048.1 helix-turn-helix domain-containing protein [Streptomyces sp. 35G-GA-8]
MATMRQAASLEAVLTGTGTGTATPLKQPPSRPPRRTPSTTPTSHPCAKLVTDSVSEPKCLSRPDEPSPTAGTALETAPAVIPDRQPGGGGEEALRLYTADQAAQLLQIPVSWLRKKATAHAVPHTRIGRHLRFSASDLKSIIRTGAQASHSG